MANPWLKKNPFLSLWLSTVHRGAGVVRGQVVAEVRRQVKAAGAEANAPPATWPKPRRKR